MRIYSNTYDCFWTLLNEMDTRDEFLSKQLYAYLKKLSNDYYFKDNYGQTIAYYIYRKHFKTLNPWFIEQIATIYANGNNLRRKYNRYPALIQELLQTKIIFFEGYVYTFVVIEADTSDIFIVLTGFQKYTKDLYYEINMDGSYISTNIQPSFILPQNEKKSHIFKQMIGSNIYQSEKYTFINTYDAAIQYSRSGFANLDMNICEHMMQQILPYLTKSFFIGTQTVMRVNGFLIACFYEKVILIVDYNPGAIVKNHNYEMQNGNIYISEEAAEWLDLKYENDMWLEELARDGAFTDE